MPTSSAGQFLDEQKLLGKVGIEKETFAVQVSAALFFREANGRERYWKFLGQIESFSLHLSVRAKEEISS